MKTKTICATALVLLMLFSMGVEGAAIVTINTDGKTTTAETSQVNIAMGKTGMAVFTSEDLQLLSKSGEPQIPWKTMTVLLPPNADMTTVSCSIISAEYETIEGVWDVAPAPPILTRDADGNEIEIWPVGKKIVDGCDTDIYSADALWPSEDVQLTGKGRLRGWRLAEIAVPLVHYNPVSGELQRLVQAEIAVDCNKKGKANGRSASVRRDVVKGRRRGHDRVKKLTMNFDDAVVVYEAADGGTESIQQDAPADDDGALSLSPAGTSGYVIITTNDIRANSTKLADFVTHKQSMGFTVTVIDEDDTGATEMGDSAATKLREWLQANYISMDLKYALIIGDPRPDEDYVPMKLYPCGTRNIPTDYFYAELTCDWDSNDNGIIGESGEIERYFEVYVGRIPYYGVMTDMDAILQKTIDYETATDTDWRYKTLISVVPLDTSMHCYNWGEQVKTDILEPKAISSDRAYRNGYGHTVTDYCIVPPPEFPASAYPATVWSQGQYGLHIWSTHGWAKGASGIISSGDTPNLNDNYPSTVWQGSCENAHPYYSDNLSYSMLKNGGIVTLGATRNSYYYYQTNFSNSPSDPGMGYRYAKGVAEGKSCGEAIWDLKEEISSWWTHNWTLFNPYGDPSVVVMLNPPDFTITPTDTFYTQVDYTVGSSASRTYTLKNNSGSSLNWTANKAADWFDLSAYSGTIPASGSVTVNITLNAEATANLSMDTHEDVVTFTDTTNNIVEERKVVLVIGLNDPLKGYWKLDETTGTIAADSSRYGNDGELTGELSFDTNAATGTYGGTLDIDDAGNVILPAAALAFINQEITICLWAYGDTTLPAGSNYLISASDSRRNRVLNVHLPWTNGSVYWDAGNSGTSTYDRIYKAATEAEYKGSWRHWAFVKNASTGDMRIYLDGVLWHSGTGMTRTMAGVSSFTFGSSYDGTLDDIRVYNYALSFAEIQSVYAGGPAESPDPFDKAVNLTLETELSWTMGASAVGNNIYIGIDHTAVENADTNSPLYKGRQADAIYQTGMLETKTEYFWRIDQVDGSDNVITGRVWSFTTGNGTGGITRQVWEGISGAYVYDLKDSPAYPDNPTFIDELSLFEGPTNWADNYGTKIHGFLVPKVTGNYTFWIASDDRSELWLSSDKEPANIAKIAEVAGIMATWTDPREWDKYPSQQSVSIKLFAGKPYYIMALHKEGNGGDNLAVAWQGPGINQGVIEGKYLMPYYEGYDWTPKFSSDPVTATNAVEGILYDYTISGIAEAFNEGAITYSKLAGPAWLNVASDGTLSGVTRDSDATGTNNFTINAEDSDGNTSQAQLNIVVLNMFTGEMGLSDFAGLAYKWLSTDCTDTPLCGGADLDGNSDVDSDDLVIFGQKWLW